MINIILCGGNGTRLWPISRTLFPKQFTKFEEHSLFQQTILRNSEVVDSQLIVTNDEQQFLAKDQLLEVGSMKVKFILEAIGRNTAGAIALACNTIEDKNEIVLVTPSDHSIKNSKEYIKIMKQAKRLAEEGYIITFGIKPTRPETGYGYVQLNGGEVVSFKEKPEKKLAQQYIDDGNFYWNSGIFMFRVDTLLNELEKYEPHVSASAKVAADTSEKVGINIKTKYDSMINIPDISIDYAVMEKTNLLKVIPMDIGWSDMGSFESLDENLDFCADNNGNVKNSYFYGIDASNNFIMSDKTVAAIDVNDLIVIDTPDALLVSAKGSSHKVKDIVAELKLDKPNIVDVHLTAHRPWGIYTVLEEKPGFKIKKIIVKPGKKLSLQKHHHRNEHWIVVSGTATVTIEDKDFFVRPNESTYIKMGEIHRLENSGKIDLVLIEVQVGEYLEEDDIIRLEDDFSRE